MNACYTKNAPGRRADWHEWPMVTVPALRGFTLGCILPGQEICAVRTVLRHLNELVLAASQCVQHMY